MTDKQTAEKAQHYWVPSTVITTEKSMLGRWFCACMAVLSSAAESREDALAEHCVERRRPRHSHTYERVGHGGAGWTLYRCSTCGDTEIDA